MLFFWFSPFENTISGWVPCQNAIQKRITYLQCMLKISFSILDFCSSLMSTLGDKIGFKVTKMFPKKLFFEEVLQPEKVFFNSDFPIWCRHYKFIFSLKIWADCMSHSPHMSDTLDVVCVQFHRTIFFALVLFLKKPSLKRVGGWVAGRKKSATVSKI